MKQKIKKMFATALLSMVVLGMTVCTLPASAATGSADDCVHLAVRLINSELYRYTNANSQAHQVEYLKTYGCKVCGYIMPPRIETYTEPHQQVPGTLYCHCGYYLR